MGTATDTPCTDSLWDAWVDVKRLDARVHGARLEQVGHSRAENMRNLPTSPIEGGMLLIPEVFC